MQTGSCKPSSPGLLFCKRPNLTLVNFLTRSFSIIAFRYIPNSVVAKPVSVVWLAAVQDPWYKLPYRTRLSIGWLCLLGIIFGSAFGFPLQSVGTPACSLIGHFLIPLFRVLHLETAPSMSSVSSFFKLDFILPPAIGLKYLGQLKFPLS